MATYLVTVHRTPGMRYIDSRQFRADDASTAIIEAKRLASLMMSRRQIAKYRIWFTVLQFRNDGMSPEVIAKGPLSRGMVHGR